MLDSGGHVYSFGDRQRLVNRDTDGHGVRICRCRCLLTEFAAQYVGELSGRGHRADDLGSWLLARPIQWRHQPIWRSHWTSDIVSVIDLRGGLGVVRFQ